jgi:hypothetical protein
MITAVLLFWLVFSGVQAVVYLVLSFRAAIELDRARELECEPRPGLQFTSSWIGALGLLCLISALLTAAGLAAHLEGAWRIVLVVLANLVMQPICLFAVACGINKVGHALCSRITYAGQVVPRESIPPQWKEKYWFLLIERIAAGLFLVLFGCGLSFLCIWPAL